MPLRFGSRLQHAWNAFFNKDPTENVTYINYGSPAYSRPDRHYLSSGNKKSIVSSIYNRIAVDASMMNIEHVRLDENNRYKETMKTGLNEVLTVNANIDQTSKDFIRDIIMSMFDEGSVALVITEATMDPALSTSYDVLSMRVGQIVQWYPRHVKVRLYNDITGKFQEIIQSKEIVAIIENPFYATMNEPNSVLQQLIRKINLLDYIEKASNYGKLDLIIQLPYVIKSKTRKDQAEIRRKDIEDQLAGSQYGIAYIDGTEKITQLNRPVENKLWGEITDLTNRLYNQLGLTESIINGTATEQAMLNYYNRTIDPILSAIVDAMKRTFLSKTARTQGQSIYYFRDPFRLVPVKELAEIADKFTRNEIASSNEMRAVIGYKPSDDPRADELLNKNISQDSSPASGFAGGSQLSGFEEEESK